MDYAIFANYKKMVNSGVNLNNPTAKEIIHSDGGFEIFKGHKSEIPNRYRPYCHAFDIVFPISEKVYKEIVEELFK